MLVTHGLALLVAALLAQGLDGLASEARRAFTEHDFAPLLEDSPGVVIHLPDAPAGPPVRPAAAIAALDAFVRRTEELSVEVRAARAVEAGFGYVELIRRFRPAGIQESHVQQVLLSLRQAGARWRVTEVFVLDLPVEAAR